MAKGNEGSRWEILEQNNRSSKTVHFVIPFRLSAESVYHNNKNKIRTFLFSKFKVLEEKDGSSRTKKTKSCILPLDSLEHRFKEKQVRKGDLSFSVSFSYSNFLTLLFLSNNVSYVIRKTFQSSNKSCSKKRRGSITRSNLKPNLSHLSKSREIEEPKPSVQSESIGVLSSLHMKSIILSYFYIHIYLKTASKKQMKRIRMILHSSNDQFM